MGYATDVGRGSEFNQDKLGFYRPDDPRLANLAGSIYVVADGMGTRERGSALADQAIRALVRAYYAAVRDHGPAEALAVAMGAADRSLRQSLTENPDPGDAGVTVAALVVRGEEVIAGHAGDCRAYLVRDGTAYRLTDDSAITSYLGRGTAPEPAISDRVAIGPGDRILLCTDGLHQLVPEEQVGSVVAGHGAQEAADKLIGLANGRGGWDNITAVVVAPFATAATAPRPVPPPAAPTATEIPWRTVALVTAPILLVAALVLLVPWSSIGQQLSQVRLGGVSPAATLVAAVTLVPESTVPPTPTEPPTPTAPTVVLLIDLSLETADNARQYALSNGLELEEVKQYSATVQPGFVISQSPRQGAELKPGDTLQIAVSLGPPPPPTRAPVRRPIVAPTVAPPSPTLVLAPTTVPSPTPVPVDPDDDKPKPRPTQPPPPAPTDKPEPPTPKPDLPTPKPEPTDLPLGAPAASQAKIEPGRVRGLAAPAPMPAPAVAAPMATSWWSRIRSVLTDIAAGVMRALTPGDDMTRAPAPAGVASAGSPVRPMAPFTSTLTATPVLTPTVTVTATATLTATVAATATLTNTATATLTSTATVTTTATSTLTPSATWTVDPNITPTATLTATATLTPTSTFTPTPTFTPTRTPTSTPTATNTPTNTPTPTPTPTFTPAPAYLPKAMKGYWLQCVEPWPGIDDPEPNDSPATAIDVCSGMEYRGHLWRPSGPPDIQDWFELVILRRVDLWVTLQVPTAANGDYDVGVYEAQPGGGYRLLDRSTGGPGQNENVTIGGLTPGRYWIQIWGQGQQIEAPYRLRWEAR